MLKSYIACRMTSGDLLLELRNQKEYEKLPNLVSFGDAKVTVTPHRTMNTTRGVVSDDDLLELTEAELLEGFTGDQYQKNPDGSPLIPVVSSEVLLQFLQGVQEIHLQMMNLEDWISSKCFCMKSVLKAPHPKGCERTLECYTYAKVSYAPETIKVLIGTDRMIRMEETVRFDVTKVDELMSVNIKTVKLPVPTDNVPEDFPRTYVVLSAAKDCLLVTYGESSDGQQKCLLWGLSRNNVSEDTECYKALRLFCLSKTYDLTETDNPCQQFDVDEERRNKKAKQEEETLQHHV
ncbi:uncharacterized protein LOC142569023 isoform X3 [Dermacentor variabilis]|uniref:uncharacterized protein LOC142569023 isoform X3 n=1 Tax=Dermacentor variabilis TaxID=34621 RepID=UPI003F5CB488